METKHSNVQYTVPTEFNNFHINVRVCLFLNGGLFMKLPYKVLKNSVQDQLRFAETNISGRIN